MASPQPTQPVPDLTSLPLFAKRARKSTPAASRLDGHRPAPLGPQPASAAAVPEPAPAATSPAGGGDVDWDLVRVLRDRVAEGLREAGIAVTSGVFSDDDIERGRSIIRRVMDSYTHSTLDVGGVLAPEQEAATARALFDAVFRLGRWQPLIDEPGITDIEITGCDQVWVIRTDGTGQVRDPVAATDDELTRDIATLAELRGRSFSGHGGNWALHLTLEDQRTRLLAFSSRVSHRPVVRLRKDPADRPTLTQLVGMGMLDENLAAFLTAAVRAGKSIVISGRMGSGKTTLLRALARETPPWESVATLESEREVYLHADGERRPVISIEGHPGGTETDPATPGRRAGQIELTDVFPHLLRGNLDRIIVGECRGSEVMAMFLAMQQGAGSLCTIHARSANDTIGRLVTMAAMSRVVDTHEAQRLVGHHIELIVYVDKHRDYATGAISRYVSQVLAIGPGGDADDYVAKTQVFWPAPTSVRPRPKIMPGEEFMLDLARAGYPRDQFQPEDPTR